MELPAAAKNAGTHAGDRKWSTETSCFTQKTIFQDKYPQVFLSGKIKIRDKSTDSCST